MTSLFGGGTSLVVGAAGSVIPQQFTPIDGQTLFTLSAFSYIPNTASLWVFVNGDKQRSGLDYTETSSTSFTLTFSVLATDVVEVIGFPAATLTVSGLTSVVSNLIAENQTATAGQTLFTLTTGAYTPGNNSLVVYMNGLKLRKGTDYIETSTISITLVSGANIGDEIDFIFGTVVNASIGAGTVGFTQSGTGAVATDVQTALRNLVVTSIANLKTVAKGTSPSVFVTGYYAQGDGGGGAYYYDSTDTSSVDNGGTIIVAADGGRWKLSTQGFISCKQFGAYGDNTHDDTAALNAWIAYLITAGNGNGRTGLWTAGKYKVSGTGVLVSITNYLPPMYTDGADQTILTGSITTLITFSAPTSGMLPNVQWGGIRVDGGLASGMNEGVRVNGLSFFTLKGWHFYNVMYGVRLYNLAAGVFGEGVVTEDCYFDTTCTTAWRYSVGAGTNSARSSGMKSCTINMQTGPAVIIDSGVVPYYAPMDVTFWNYNANGVFIQNNSSQCPVLGNFTMESFPATNKLTMCSGSGYILWMGAIAGWGTNWSKLFKGNLIRCKEFFSTSDGGTAYLTDTTSGQIASTGVGQSFTIPYFAGSHVTDAVPKMQDSAILTLSVSNTSTGYLWQGTYMLMSGSAANVVNPAVIASNLITNTAGYGAMTVSQGTSYNVTVSNGATATGTLCTYSIQYLTGLIRDQ